MEILDCLSWHLVFSGNFPFGKNKIGFHLLIHHNFGIFLLWLEEIIQDAAESYDAMGKTQIIFFVCYFILRLRFICRF